MCVFIFIFFKENTFSIWVVSEGFLEKSGLRRKIVLGQLWK